MKIFYNLTASLTSVSQYKLYHGTIFRETATVQNMASGMDKQKLK